MERIKRAFVLLGQDLRQNLPGILAVIAYILLFQFLFDTICPMQIFLGLPCPGCGLTRAGFLLLGGHPIEAFRMHPFLYGWIAAAADFCISRYLLDRKAKELPYFLAFLLLGMIAFYIWRMKMYFPDTEPMQPLTEGLIGRIIRAAGV